MKVYILVATNTISNHVFIPFVFFTKEQAMKRREEMVRLNSVWKKVVIKEREVHE